MRNQLFFPFIISAFISAFIFSACNNPKGFKSDVQSIKKPWTNLNFKNDPDNFQFAIISDRNGGNRPGVFEKGVEKLNMMIPEFVICVGDLIAGYTLDTTLIKKEWEEVNGIVAGLKMPFFYLPGNHDITNKVMEKEWEKLYGRRYYSFVYKNTLFITLDTNDDDDFNLTRTQTDFVLKTLKKNSDVRWTFIFMHHPIWKYNTDGRFEKIEKVLTNRKYTVIAGHEHQYHHAERNGSNYYILSTTGGSSSLRGNYMGEFDHISWVTVTDDGPVMANLRLDGILSHDISNDKTARLAGSMLENTSLTNLILCNKGEKFSKGTLYLSFKNSSDSELEINLNFFHHHQIQIEKSEVKVLLEAGSNKIIEIPISSAMPVDYGSIDLLRFDWEMKYNNPEYPGFAMQGKYQIPVKPTETGFINKDLNVFIGKTVIGFDHQFSNLETVYRINNSAEMKYEKPFEIAGSSRISLYLKNNKNEFSADECRNFEKSDFHLPADVTNPKQGLKFRYYEGNWQSMPDLSKLEAKSEGFASDFSVRNYAQREDNWGLVFTGFIKVEEDNLYMFRIRADDVCRLYINDKVVVDEKSLIKGGNIGAAALKKGFHPVRIEFLEIQGDQKLRLYTKTYKEENWKPVASDLFYY